MNHIAEPLRTLAVNVSDLNLDSANARTHSQKNLDAIRASLTRFGQRAPIVVQRQGMRVRAGNGRVIAARDLGWKTIAAVVVDESDVEATAYAIADNRSSDLAEWDDDILADLIGTLPADVVADIGFDTDDLAELFNDEPDEIKDDEVPEPPANPVTKTGDVWTLGRHRLICGDATQEDDVTQVLAGATPLLMVTDPPYGVDYSPEWRSEAAAKGQYRADWREAWMLCSADVVYCWSAPGALLIVSGMALQSAGFCIRASIMWNKPHFPISRGHYTFQHELCWYAVRDGKGASWSGPKNASTVWPIALDKNVDGGHGTQKPIACMATPIRNHDAPEVYDPFLGSGTTLIAAEQLDRTCYGIEISPAYCDVVVERWQNLTGEKATR